VNNGSDYDRFVGGVASSKEHVERIVDGLLSEKKINQAVRDALLSTTMRLLRDAYQAGRCEPAGVTDLLAELTRVSA